MIKKIILLGVALVMSLSIILVYAMNKNFLTMPL